MSDRLTREQRHRCMAAIKSRNTRPEWVVRRYLFAHGFRYRLCDPRLPGHPDLVLTRYRTVIFVNGCFWHGHKDCKLFVLPKTNAEFWRAKIERNQQRDAQTTEQLRQMGWNVIRIWECQLAKNQREETLRGLTITLSHFLACDLKVGCNKPHSYQMGDDEKGDMVAEE